MTAFRQLLSAAVIALLLPLPVFPNNVCAADDRPDLQVAISLDIPPFVMAGATSGLEVAIVRQALDDASVRFVQMSYEDLQSAVQERGVDISIGVQPVDDTAWYSADLVNFANYAISLKADNLHIDSVAELSGHPVVTWEGAYLELGPEFKAMFAPQGPQRKDYNEVADQRQQVMMFWEGSGQVIVIDRNIFDYFSRDLGYDTARVSYHAIFPPVTNFKAAFRNRELRDQFNERLETMCQSGAYAKLLQHYGVTVETSVCE